MREGHHQVSTDILDIEWSPIPAQSRKSESIVIAVAVMTVIVIALMPKESKATIEDFNPSRLEIGRVEPRIAVHLCYCTTFIDRFTRAILDDHSVGIHRWIPARDGSILR